ncbi:lactose-binding lectin l-2-like [Amphibalanus amphitrite]|uniref:lactose-binding lectin l-2-like n=1 Tax=Amphibalanus amphitrite TaxID=1232801 RepID=UPI001C913610|nr:lactose-binding lectin l-2-like [Amphibalanus amphitrite]
MPTESALLLSLALLSRVATSHGSAPTTADHVVSGLAEVCTAGVRDAVQHEVRETANQAVSQLRSGQQELNATLHRLQDQLASLQPAAAQCPDGWRRHQDSCYLVTPHQTTWMAAHHVCAALDRRARLASVHPGSAAFLKSLAKSYRADQLIWIGLARLSAGGSWSWSDGSPVDYADWDGGQPNNAKGVEDCAHFGGGARSAEKRWHDNSCTRMYLAMCQINLS